MGSIAQRVLDKLSAAIAENRTDEVLPGLVGKDNLARRARSRPVRSLSPKAESRSEVRSELERIVEHVERLSTLCDRVGAREAFLEALREFSSRLETLIEQVADPSREITDRAASGLPSEEPGEA